MYSTYEEALADCTESDYENLDIVEVVLRKTMAYRDEISTSEVARLTPTTAFSLCSLLASVDSREINVVDFGGACGANYFLARAMLPKSVKLRWVVVETPAMAQRAASLLATDELSFSSDLGSAVNAMNRIHLLHTSGTLQCLDKPYDYLARLVSTSADHILFNRLALTKGSKEVITVDESWLSWHGPGPMPNGLQDKKVRYPFTLIREGVFYEALRRSYDVAMAFDDDTGVLHVGNEQVVGGGVLARLKR